MRLLETAHIKDIATIVKAHFELFLYEFWFVLKKTEEEWTYFFHTTTTRAAKTSV